MGKNNRQRRAHKQRKRADQQRARQHSTAAAPRERRTWHDHDAGAEDPASLFLAAADAYQHRRDHDVAELVDRLTSLPHEVTSVEVQRRLVELVTWMWGRGWQPAVLHRTVSRQAHADDASRLRDVLADEAAGYEALGREVAPDWMAQLDGLGITPSARRDLRDVGDDWRATIASAVRLVSLLRTLPDLPVLTPPPSQWQSGVRTTTASSLPPGLLEKVRALLAKAESTSYDAEADAFTAKAQELMARHRIDRAVLDDAQRCDDDQPVGRRVFVDDPYAEAKAMLLTEVADANGGSAIYSKGFGFCTVFAHTDELDLIDDLFTSLLVQATAALRREGSKTDPYGRSRTTKFRRSFLLSFGARIGERLREAVDATVAEAEAETGRSLVPVLADRADESRAAAEEAFPEVRTFHRQVTDREGWIAGRVFGDQADIGSGASLGERAS
ncbi:MAG: DUF2786 domain-containing protein [Acidimicrobiales bacterium]|nr:DUF2786 domain-containing protein [Acidimicrobiales bacterium]